MKIPMQQFQIPLEHFKITTNGSNFMNSRSLRHCDMNDNFKNLFNGLILMRNKGNQIGPNTMNHNSDVTLDPAASQVWRLVKWLAAGTFKQSQVHTLKSQN